MWHMFDGSEKEFFTTLYRIDIAEAEQVRARGCRCGGRLHRGDYPRKVRGIPLEHEALFRRRFSFCCNQEGCRRRYTPPSVRFFGPMVYAAAAVFVVMWGLFTASGRITEVPRRTQRRWRKQLPVRLAQSTWWQQARGQVMPPVDESALPCSLMQRRSCHVAEALVPGLRFFSPLTVKSAGLARAG